MYLYALCKYICIYIYIYISIYNPEYTLRGIVIYQFFIALFQTFFGQIEVRWCRLIQIQRQ